MNNIWLIFFAPLFYALLSRRPLIISWLVEGKLVCHLSSLATLQSYHSDLAIHLLTYPFTTVCVCLSVFVCWTLSCQAVLYYPAWKRSCFPFNGPWKRLCSLSAVAENPCSKISVWSCVIEKRSERRRQKVCLAFTSQFIASDVSEHNRWQLCTPLNHTSKDDKMVSTVGQFDQLKWADVDHN